MIDELELLRRARPEVGSPSRGTRRAARRALDERIASGAPRSQARSRSWSPQWLAPAFGGLVAVLIVAAVAAAVLSVHGRRPTPGGSGRGLELMFRAEPTPQVPHVGPAAMRRTVQGVGDYLDVVLPGAQVRSSGNELIVRVRPGRTSAGQAAELVRQSERLLYLYDWEANALTPTGRSVASLLPQRAPAAVLISQGGTNAAPGAPGAGGISLYQAVRLAAGQPGRVSANSSRSGPEYFMFARAGSKACAIAARYYHGAVSSTRRCYLAGPQDTIDNLHRALPPGVDASSKHAQTLTVHQGWLILQATAPRFGDGRAWSDPTAQYYVIRDNPALLPADITNPRPSTDQAGAPDVTFGFTKRGGAAFQNLTAQIAKRGELDSRPSQKVFQHFAAVVGGQLITVPFIDYAQDPDGIPANHGAAIQGAFTITTAQQLAQMLKLGALPVHLKLIHAHG